MAQCPQCQSEIEISESHHGTLFTCPKCQAVFFVGWDGTPEQPQNQVVAPPAEPINENTNEFIPQFTPEPVATPEQPAANFQDVLDYGNSTELRGNLTYTLTIEGIEIADIREQFKEALIDSRFGWDVDSVLKQIEGGKITLYDLSPAKAVALINRIKYLPIRISWRQNALS